jgi:CheY-like chemotaxis protein
VLTNLGISGHVAKDGREVLEVESNPRYPDGCADAGHDGLEATRMIRLCLEKQKVTIAVPANAMQGHRDEYLRAGVDDCISKSIYLTELVIVLEK